MKPRIFASFAAAALVFAFALDAAAQSNFKVDPVHSFVVFHVKHLGVANAWGRFNEPTGLIVWDEANPQNSRIEITVPAEKVDTGNKKRDDHLRSPDFFNAKQFPTITFKSTSISKQSDEEFEVAGDLTLHGVTKPITVTLKKVGEATTQAGHRAGWETSFAVNRSEYGMTFMQGGVGDEVTLNVAIEGIRQ